ncbi:thaumatin-like protein 1b [Gossypium australe]|uniref:Thaumatin-like protein 1b n=1 Tax=Gossypium australe TaxID=47621 RepID=A0A5B6VB20_9ROSI|nr:thaumatin-like protein 1b [Gossypium australe]
MEVQVIFALSLAIFFFNEAQSSTFMFKNNCPYTVWLGILTGAGPQLSSTGFELASQASLNLNVLPPWSGRFWGRTHCVTTDEFTLAPNNGKYFYDISLVDGFNLPLSVTPHGRSLGCNTTSCATDVNAVCPSELQVIKGLGGGVIACKSACLAFKQPQHCCTGAYNSPATCQPTKYSKIFKSQCPQAYSYAYDDKTSTFTCTGGANYVVTFCP